ncbi:hypothetical protein [Streptosporangium sp. NPDC049046]|uniref:hypothetical protein n=1 Tax=unclassified Streptosporangium TaxID=2632669 RepID=UPI0034293008
MPEVASVAHDTAILQAGLGGIELEYHMTVGECHLAHSLIVFQCASSVISHIITLNKNLITVNQR